VHPIGIVAAVLLALLPQAAAGADEAPAAAPARESMVLKVANRPVITLRGPIAGYSARERVTAAAERIEQSLAATATAAVAMEPAPEGTRVTVGGQHAFLVTKIDVDPLAGENTELVARYAAQRLERAIAERREQQTPRYLGIAFAYAAAASLLYGALLWLIFGANRWAGERLSATAARKAQALEVDGHRLLDASRVLGFTRRVITAGAWLLALLLTSIWLSFVLERFPYTRPWGEELHGYLIGFARELLLAVAGAVPGLLFAVVIFFAARTLARILSLFFERVQRGDRKVGWIDPDTARPTQRIAIFTVWVFALAIAYPYLPGAQTEAFKGLSVMLGLMASLGAASIVGQAFNGFILMYSRAFRAGDYVRIGEVEGTIESLGTFVTRVRTGLGELITLPNSTVMSAAIRNYSRSVPGAGCVIDTTVTIGYSTPWRQVHAMLEEAARRTHDVSTHPAPRVRQLALSDFYIEYRLIAHSPAIDPAHRADVLNRLHGAIQDVFNEHGVQIMSPHYLGDPAEPQVVPKEQWYAAPARPPSSK
jgi:small-conductance mechanosensitive channel